MDNGNLVSKCIAQGGGVIMLGTLHTKQLRVQCITNYVISGVAGVAMISAMAEAGFVAVQIKQIQGLK